MNSFIHAKAVSSQPIFNAGTERFMRDWSGIATVTVRDSRNREHDPILGVVPLKLSDIFSSHNVVPVGWRHRLWTHPYLAPLP